MVRKINFQLVKKIFIEQLKGRAIKFALKKILGSALMGGFKAWLIKFIVTELFEEVAEPIIDLGFRKLGYVIDKQKGKNVLKRIKNAKKDEDWFAAANDV